MIRLENSSDEERRELAKAAAEFQNMLRVYVGELFGVEVAQEVGRVIPEILAEASNWQIGSEELGARINQASHLLSHRFGVGSYSFGLSAQGMLRRVSRDYGCNPLEVARMACGGKVQESE